ncbi:Do family serine endopeptidase [Hydrogenophaga sp.]|uniref:Do family serine endopeptidase n=1 Tax=Hydrogenophaga sp. TaxID=1904254 RepID=UPI0019A62858|nr:Do family serine endopeptidase [Hydrogenophaga sp.]MBD3893260.1 Do family serine endopeptidase [Hydrogenophaga sp.]
MTSKQQTFKTLWALSAAAVVGAAGLLALWVHQPLSAQTPAQAAAAPMALPAARGLPDFADLVDQVGPSVVNIRTLERAPGRRAPGFGPDEQMLEFFRRFGIPIPPGVLPRSPQPPGEPADQLRPSGVGSGFILSADGFIMTNAHVVEGADELLVTLVDQREFKARVVGADRRTDVAVIKIEATGLSPVRIGDVNRLRVGDWVLAIGSPFGLENTVTAGIVSAKKRDTGDFLRFIQTDVAINPGNSGGPLINMRGEVVGINSQIYSRSGGFQGISFAIPIDEAAHVAEQLRTTGRVTRGRIGVQIGEVSREVAEAIGLGEPRGALVRSVEVDSPAARGGVEPGDIIVRFDAQDIRQSIDLPRLVANTRPGTVSRITVFRRGTQRELTLTVADLEPPRAAPRAAAPESPRPQAGGPAQALGLTLADLTPAQLAEMSLRGGVRIAAVEGAAARAGLREGDVIVALAHFETSNLRALETVLARLDRTRPVHVLFRRGDMAQFAVIRPSR